MFRALLSAKNEYAQLRLMQGIRQNLIDKKEFDKAEKVEARMSNTIKDVEKDIKKSNEEIEKQQKDFKDTQKQDEKKAAAKKQETAEDKKRIEKGKVQKGGEENKVRDGQDNNVTDIQKADKDDSVSLAQAVSVASGVGSNIDVKAEFSNTDSGEIKEDDSKVNVIV